MANKQSKLKSVNCTQCSAPIDLHGGRQVETIVCGYCGSVLDNKEEYKVLKQYKDQHRPYLPLKLGSKIKFKGVKFTLIGVVGYRVSGDTGSWIEYQMFSPTHGYAWLEYENGHFVFSRRTRELPDETIKEVRKSSFKAGKRQYRVFEAYTAIVDYVEGELTWVALRGKRIKIVDGIAPPFVYSMERSKKEIEYYQGEYIDRQYMLDNVDKSLPRPEGVHAAQPFIPGSFLNGLFSAGKVFAPLALVIWLMLVIFASGNTILSSSIAASEYIKTEAGAIRKFTISKPGRLVSLDISSGLNNAWGYYDFEIAKAGKPIFTMSKSISYYHGTWREGGESGTWSEGSQSAHAYFKVPEAGEYTFRVWGEGGQGNSGQNAQQKALNVKISEGVIASRYFVWLIVIFLLATLARYFYKLSFEARRWATEDDDDEDD